MYLRERGPSSLYRSVSMMTVINGEVVNILIIFLITLFIIYNIQRMFISTLPPGPKPIPLLGNILSLRFRPFNKIGEWAKRYGDILTVYYGPIKKVVWINDANIGIDTFVKRANIFSVRKNIPFISYMIGEKGSVAFENGPAWKQGRRWMLSVLRKFEKTSLEAHVVVESDALCDAISKHNCEPFDPNHVITCAVANVICSMSFSKRYEYTDVEFNNLLSNLQTFMKQMNISNILTHLPFLTKLPFFKHTSRPSQQLVKFVQKHIDEHELTIDRDNIRDIVDSLIVEVEKSDEEAAFSKETIYNTILTFFVAGAETTSTTMMWFIYFMACYPEEQEKVYDEIHTMFGDGQPTAAELVSKLPYFVATICEVQRLGCTVPSLLPRGTSEECDLSGYKLPKGTNVNLNIMKVHTDPAYWENPEEFNPSRFLGEDGETVIKPKSFMPFGLGRRICIGENMAKLELHIITSKLLQRYTLVVPDGQPKPAFDPMVGFTVSSRPFEITAVPRT